MLLEMDLQDIPTLKPSSLHLRHFSCKPYRVNDTRAVFRVPFQECGTTQGTEKGYLLYHNVVENALQSNSSRVAISKEPKLYFPFTCRYRDKYIVTLSGSQGVGEKNREQENGKMSGVKDVNEKKQGKSRSYIDICTLNKECNSLSPRHTQYIYIYSARIWSFVILSPPDRIKPFHYQMRNCKITLTNT